jgi:hypothetical protein
MASMFPISTPRVGCDAIVKWVNPKEVDQAQMGLYMAGVKD